MDGEITDGALPPVRPTKTYIVAVTAESWSIATLGPVSWVSAPVGCGA